MEESSFLALTPHGFCRVAYTQWGTPRPDRVVVCAHGLTRNGRDFDFLAESLQADHWVVCPDMPGRGRSENLLDPADYGYPVYTQVAAALLAHLNVEEVFWVGTSMGGIIGMMLAAHPNSPVKRLVVNDIGPRIPGAALQRIATYVGKTGPFHSLSELEQYLRRIHAPFGPLTDLQWRHLAEHGHWRRGEESYLAYDPGIGKAFQQDQYADIELWEVWDRISQPTLVLQGADSDILDAETAAQMLRRGPPARLQTFSGVGHAPVLMADDQIRVVRNWLNAAG